MRLFLVFCTLLLAIFMATSQSRSADPAVADRAEESSLLILRGEGIVAGLLPQAGGRLVLLRNEVGPNWLDSRAADWAAATPEPTIDTPFSYTLLGATVWAGPQSAFWTDQDLNPKAKAEKWVWPPDPFFEWGHCSVQRRSDREVELDLPDSPVTGLRLTKTYRITGPGELSMEITATNTRNHPVRRDLWPDVRVDSLATVRVPVESERAMRLATLNGANPDVPTIQDGFIVWPGVKAGAREWSAKAFITPTRQEIVCERDQARLTLQGSLADASQIHPEHAAVELFRSAGPEPRLEAEMHGAFVTLKPQDKITFRVTFKLGNPSQPPPATTRPG